MDRNEVALRIFCAMLVKDDRISLFPEYGERQIRMAFGLARTFLDIAEESPVRESSTNESRKDEKD